MENIRCECKRHKIERQTRQNWYWFRFFSYFFLLFLLASPSAFFSSRPSLRNPILVVPHDYSLISLRRNVISTWSSGTGGAGIIGAMSYAGLAMVLEPETTLLVMLVVPVLQAITFWCILKHPAHTKIPITKNGIDSQEQIIKMPKKTFKQKISLVPGLLKYMIPLGLVYLFEYFINQGLVTRYFILLDLSFSHYSI